jgi:hypothetical protein
LTNPIAATVTALEDCTGEANRAPDGMPVGGVLAERFNIRCNDFPEYRTDQGLRLALED